MRTMGKTENKKNMHENEMKVVSRMKAYQKLAERAISRKRPNRHMIRRGVITYDEQKRISAVSAGDY